MFSWKTNFTKSKVWEKHKKHKKSCSYSPELLFIEPNNLVISCGQIGNNPLATKVWGQILSKDNNFVPPSYLFMFVFCVIIVLLLLFCVLFPTTTNHAMTPPKLHTCSNLERFDRSYLTSPLPFLPCAVTNHQILAPNKDLISFLCNGFSSMC